MNKLNVGCGLDIRKGWINLDNHKTNGAEVVFDLNEIYEGKKMPFPENSFDYVLMNNALYLFVNPVPILNELVRVCKKGGFIEILSAMPNAPTSINFLRGHTKSQFINFAGSQDIKGDYSLDKRTPGRLKVIECKYIGGLLIKKLICGFFNILPCWLVERTFLMYLSAMRIKVIYQKIENNRM